MPKDIYNKIIYDRAEEKAGTRCAGARREKIGRVYSNMERTEIVSLYQHTPADGTQVTVCGWAKNIRDSKNIGFIALSDGGTFKTLQVVLQADKLSNYDEIVHSGIYTSMRVKGRVVLTPEARQPFELNAESVEILGTCPSDEYPLQKKKMSMEYLRAMPTLRPRTNTFGAAFRVRSVAAFAIHRFFQENGFVYAHTPLFTASDCEGAGEMFKVTTLDLNDVPKTEDGKVDYSKDFFEKPVNLTVSGQLEAEAMAMAFGKVYTFGPTFRAEKSFTTRHAAEFWMIEPEMAFCDLNGYMDTAEAMTKYVIRYVLENCPDEMAFFNQFVDKGLIERLELVANSEFGRLSYTDAVEILKKNNNKFQFPVEWGVDIQTEHERYLTEVVYKKPVFVTDYPKEIKSFYMKQNPDGKTVAAADMLVPGIGELIGGSQREENYDKLVARMDELGLDKTNYDWYLDLRRFGGVEHAGYGLGFERMIMYLTGIQNIRDVLPFPRTAYGF
jgi:asparaginyl-tRNA synthetase